MIGKIALILFCFVLTTCSKESRSKQVFVKLCHIIEAQEIQIDNGNPITVLKGRHPIIISAPHALKASRKGVSFADKGTGELAIMVHRLCDLPLFPSSLESKR